MCSASFSRAALVFWIDSSIGNAGISVPSGKKLVASSPAAVPWSKRYWVNLSGSGIASES